MRTRVRIAALLLSTAALSSPVLEAGAQTPAQVAPQTGAPAASDARRLAITIYNENLALVEERRTLDLPAGRSRQEFRDVSAAIRPETVSLTADGVGIVEQNFDYDLLTPDKLMQEAVGQQITIIRTNPGTGAETRETATVLAANQGVVLRIGDRIEVLRDDGVPTRVIFDRVPVNLRARPTLSVTLQSERAGRREAILSYLTTGLAWRADYVALFDERSGRVDLQGWITLTNQTGTGFADADVQLVAGDLNLISGQPQYGGGYNPRRGYYPPPPPPPPGGMAGTETGQGPRVGDYYLYPLPQRTSVEQNQTKQVGFIDARGVSGKRIYYHRSNELSSSPQARSVDVSLEFSNARAAGLGQQLPAGTVRVYQRDSSGDPKFIGENTIGHTPAGSELAIKTGSAFDVTVQSTLTSQERVDDRTTRSTLRYDFRNARSEPVTVEFRQGTPGRILRVTGESQRGTRVDAQTLGWDVRVPANGSSSLTFTVETGY
jgi:hypothetical protein